ncbi:hypothetical protein PHYSODRAFT_335222 [Phytophthora sojae]|uniref:Uncharacterized protein n=1 Tax=Phytophthora sojae (strain P6497) TaxID=1094619 RepID=G4ZUH1_PHYSP|nr:hypothetical protein PHYSODRAFT_335222 [Phytophthora sojae]EGZ13445.1 hypothetical protein PHYSODRAFT_335222 [Phytophthora sojae]|eukprot:XP_009530874.1 hypothetical protein PHYSODRAFT_335222 [Phytophthora sojae]
MEEDTTPAERAARRSSRQRAEYYAELSASLEAENARLEEEIRIEDESLKRLRRPPRPQVPFYQTSFFIAEDGFLLTTSSIYPTADRNTCKATRFDGIGLHCEHVQDFETCGTSLSLLIAEAPFPIPFLEPDKEFEAMDPMVFMPYCVGNIFFPTPLVVRGHVGALADPNSELASLELAQPNSLDYAKDILFTGGPVLSLRPHHFVGVVSSIEHDSVVRFCPVPRCSSLWKEIKVMDKYREGHETRRWERVTPPRERPDEHEFCCTLL